MSGRDGDVVAAAGEVITDLFGGADLIHVYLRSEAIDDGVLVDVTKVAGEAGIRYPVAMTRTAWEELVAWDPAHGAHQDEQGRLWDVVWLTFCEARRRRGDPTVTDRVRVEILRVPNRPGATRALRTHFWAVVGPGDLAEPVMTIMLDGES